jgi:Uma2 family endonuclease
MPELVTGRLTAEEFFALPDDGRTVELVRGEVVEMPDGGGVHGDIGDRLYGRIRRLVEERGLGKVLLPGTGFKIDPHTVRKPDIAFVPAAQWQKPPPVGFLPYPPPLAVEVVSPTDTMWEVEEKVREYLAAGTREVWVVSPVSRTVQVWSHDGRHVILSGEDRLESSQLPGFSLRVGELFEA